MDEAPSHRLLAVPELLELVLVELDQRCLLCTAQLVSRQFRDVISTSPKLQAKLFFKPLPLRHGLDNGVRPLQNPQTWKRTWRLQDLFQAPDADARHDGFPQRAAAASKERRTSIGDAADTPPQSSTAPYSLIGPWKTYQPADRAFNRRGVSWRRMLVQQPPITSIGQVVVRRRLDGTIVTRVGRADVPSGVRMGHVWDALRESMAPLKTDMCLMRLVWWEPTLTQFERALYPMAPDVSRLFDEGAQLVLAIGFSECAPPDRFYGKSAGEYDVLCHCDEFEPLDFNVKETVCFPSRRRSIY